MKKKNIDKISPTLFLNSMHKNPSPPMPPHFGTCKAHWCKTFPKFKARLHYTSESANFESWPVVLFPFCAGIVHFFPRKNEKQKVTGSF
jgi:hypothetical protein